MRTLISAGIALLAWVGEPAVAATIAEIGDAGELPGTAQSSAGVQPFGTPLDSITGTIASEFDQDMFRLFINDPANFSASTNNAGTNLSVDSDTMLFLFNPAGLGLLFNDDDVFNPPTFKSNIPAGSFTGPEGIYFVAVSLFFNSPQSAGGAIFGGLVRPDGTRGPVGPGGSLPITSWALNPSPPQTGPYRIDLTGATFVPEPSALFLLGLGVAGLAVIRRRELGKPYTP